MYNNLYIPFILSGSYKFLWTSVGAEGSASDAGVFNKSSLRRRLEEETLGVPEADPLPGDDRDTEYFFVGDDAFPLRKWLMKPFPHRGLSHRERIFNYRLSRARRIVENAFGILAQRWRVLLTTIGLTAPHTVKVVKACVALHNLIRTRYPQLAVGEVDREDEDGNIIPGQWREGRELTPTRGLPGNQQLREAKIQRLYLSDYYISPFAALPWQDRVVNV